jgi:hypothetical protein
VIVIVRGIHSQLVHAVYLSDDVIHRMARPDTVNTQKTYSSEKVKGLSPSEFSLITSATTTTKFESIKVKMRKNDVRDKDTNEEGVMIEGKQLFHPTCVLALMNVKSKCQP